MEGVAAELEEAGFAKESVEKYLDLFKTMGSGIDGVKYCKEKNSEGFLDPKVADDLTTIIQCVMEAKTAKLYPGI